MPFKPKRIADQVIVITGATSGIGLATAEMASARGARVVLVARGGADLRAVRERLERRGGEAIAVAGDVGSRADMEQVAARALAAFGRIDTWVNNAGMTIYGSLHEVEEEDNERLLRTNLWGVIHGSLVAMDHLGEHGGTIINMGSVASDLAFPLQAMYVTSKHAVKGFTDALRMELLSDGAPVNVTLIKPTSVDTPLPQRARNYMNKEPMLPPPVYPPEEVALAILNAAEHYRREVIVGGGGAVMVALRVLLPELYARLGPPIGFFQKRGIAPRNRKGALYAPQRSGRTRGDQPGYVMRSSAFTRAGLHPLATFGIVAACAGASASWLAARKNRR